MKFLPIVFFCTIAISGCSFFSHQQFFDKMERKEQFWVAEDDFPLVRGDVGVSYQTREEILSRTPSALPEDREARQRASLTRELVAREAQLSPYEFNRYMQIKDDLETVSEKIYYLRLSPGNRERYLALRLPQDRRPSSSLAMNRRGEPSSFRSIFLPVSSSREITVNMSKEEVVNRWGRPSFIEVAGDPARENERWIFVHSEGRKAIYFEKGMVQGWTLLD